MDDEFKRRFDAAKQHRRDEIEEDAREIYKFFFNGRESEWDSRRGRNVDPEEIFSDEQATIGEEFAGRLFDVMFPEHSDWVAFEASVDEENEADAKSQIEDLERDLSGEIARSNFYDEGYSSALDSIVGNMAMWVDRNGLSAIRCRALPLAKCWFNLGLNGLDDRFYQDQWFYRDLEALFPEVNTWPREIAQKIKTSKSGKATVSWGFWRSYEDPMNPQWVQNIRVDSKEIGLDMVIGGEGSCPLVAGRFNAYAGSAWGRGPGRRMLPAVRVLNEIVAMNLEGMSDNLKPAFAYPHDGLLDLSNGIESGIGYPSMPGSGDAITKLTGDVSLDYGFFTEERMVEALRNGFYLETEQRGKTPPSATQVLRTDSKTIARMARPAKKTWREFGVGFLKRVEFLSKATSQRGSLLEQGVVVPRPISPLERAQAMEEVQTADAILSMIGDKGGAEALQVLVKPSTFTNIKSALRDKLVDIRSEDEVKKMMEGMANAQAQQAPAAQ